MTPVVCIGDSSSETAVTRVVGGDYLGVGQSRTGWYRDFMLRAGDILITATEMGI
jgi:hypothetical protein